MVTVSQKIYEDIRKKVGFEKMDEIERNSGVEPEEKPGLAKVKPPTTHLQQDVAKEINQLHANVLEITQKTVEVVGQIGKLLLKKKKNVGHGNFETWVKENLVFSVRTAQNYMRVYNHRNKIKNESLSSLHSAYKTIGVIKEQPQQDSKKKVPTHLLTEKDLKKPNYLSEIAHKLSLCVSAPKGHSFLVYDSKSVHENRFHLMVKGDNNNISRTSFKIVDSKDYCLGKLQVIVLEEIQKSNSDLDKYSSYVKQVEAIKDAKKTVIENKYFDLFEDETTRPKTENEN